MAPRSHLFIKKYPRRRLKITFPNTCVKFYKLLRHKYSGSSWKKWKLQDDYCIENKSAIVPTMCVYIMLKELDQSAQQWLEKNKFMDNFLFEQKEPIWKVTYPSTSTKEYQQSVEKKEETDRESQCFCEFMAVKTNTIENNKLEDTGNQNSSLLISDTTQSFDKREGGAKNDKVVKKTRVIERFGQGVPEKCTFQLTMMISSSSEESVSEFEKLGRKSIELGPYDYLSEEKIALKTLRPDSFLYKKKVGMTENSSISNEIRHFPSAASANLIQNGKKTSLA